ncbi:MAG: hypothetical protein WB779_13595 [Ignavibacteriaceae bacterium]
MDYVFIFQIILLLAASALCVFLIIYFNRITKSITLIESNIKNFTTELKPLIESTTALSNHITEITEGARDQLDITKNIVTDVKDRVDVILNYEEKIREGIEGPVFALIKNLSAISKGIETFWKTFKK